MASEFRIYQYGKPKPITVKWSMVNNMQNPPACIQSFHFYFNNGKTINIQGGGGICYGSTRNGTIGNLFNLSIMLQLTNQTLFDISCKHHHQ